MCHDELLESLEFSTLTPFDCNIPNVSIKKYMSNGVIKVPSIKENPVNVYEMDQGEEKAFPWLFPTGMFGFSQEREQKLSLSMYLKNRLYNYRGNFRKNITYLLHSAVAVDLSHLKSEIRINMRIRKNARTVTAGDIRNCAYNDTLLQNSCMFMKNIRGTVAYFRNQLYNLLAMFKALGPPSIFMTLSADDLHRPELSMAINDVSFDEAEKRGKIPYLQLYILKDGSKL